MLLGCVFVHPLDLCATEGRLVEREHTCVCASTALVCFWKCWGGRERERACVCIGGLVWGGGMQRDSVHLCVCVGGGWGLIGGERERESVCVYVCVCTYIHWISVQ